MTDPQELALGIDVGGTFTDFFAFGPDGIRTWKQLSTPDPADAVIAGSAEAPEHGRVVHGSTVATNALLERRGPRTVLVTTRGFRDLLEIRRQTRDALYALEPQRTPHVVTRGDVVEVRERLDAEGNAIIALDEAEIARVVAEVVAMEPGAVAVCLLFAYRNPEHERRLAAALRNAGLEVSVSHEVMPEYREYERASTTAINAFLQPTVRGYLSRVAEHVSSLTIMHSAAGITTAVDAGDHPVSMVLSGPAGGVLGALAVATAAGIDDIITFDMGGTSTDVALCTGGQPRVRNSATVDGLALHTPMVDIVTVGAGGGSIAWIDDGGALRVGPRSAGANPGPAAYGRGGTEPTVSDANVVLGRLRPDRFLGGGMTLDADAASAALGSLGDAETFARATIEVVGANMARALRAVSLERGFDPADYTLVAFGGAGPLHACELAAQVGIGQVLIPRYPGVLSALGMVTASEVREQSLGLLLTLADDDTTRTTLRGAARRLEADSAGTGTPEWVVDARYRGQAHELRISIAEPDAATIVDAFHRAHEERFGYATATTPVELVTLRLRRVAASPASPLVQSEPSEHPARSTGTVVTWMEGQDRQVEAAQYERANLAAGATLHGPAIITQDDATTVVPPGWSGHIDAYLNLLLRPMAAG